MKLNYLLLFFIFSGRIVFGQCVPDTSITHNVPGVYPASLPHSIVGQPYSTVLQVKVLTDSTVGAFHGIVDSIVIDNVTGLPSGFGYTCTPSSCSFPGGSDACILLQGAAPTMQLAGVYPIVVQTTIYYKLLGTPQTLADNNTDYSILIDTTTGISSLDNINFSISQNIPNPARDFTLIPISLIHHDKIILTLSNVIGKKIYSKEFILERGRTNIPVDLHGILPGIYLYTFSNGITTVTRRMIISND